MREHLNTGFRIGDWEVYPQENLLKKPGRARVLEPKVMDLLVYLAGTRGDVISRRELLESVWSGTVVGDETLSRAVSVLRTELGDDSRHPRYLKTISKRGYCIVAEVAPIARASVRDVDLSSVARPVPAPAAPLASTVGSTHRRYALAVAGIVSLAVLAIVLGHYAIKRMAPETAGVGDAALPSDKIMLAVLPLENLSGDPRQEFFSDGLTEEIIAQLGTLHRDRLGVIARTSVMYYKGKNRQLDEIGRELGVDYVLEGSVRRAEDRVRITAQLIQVSDQTHLWARSFERDLADIFALQSDVAERVTRTLALELLPTQKARARETVPSNYEAYEAYLRGRYHESRGGVEDLVKASEHYSRAIQKDPEYALAYASLGHTYGARAALGSLPLDEANRNAWQYTMRAVEIDPGLAEAQVTLADFKFYVDWEWSEGEAGFRRAYEANPGSETVVWHYALCLHLLGRYDEAISVLERALELDPYSVQLNRELVYVLLNSRQHVRAIQQLRKMAEFEPGDSDISQSLGDVYSELGRYDEAVGAYLTSRDLAGDSPETLQALRMAFEGGGIRGYWEKRVEQLTAAGKEIPLVRYAFIYARLGDGDQALAWLQQAAQQHEILPLDFARIYTLIGEKEQALAWLGKAYEQRTVQLAWIKVERTWDSLRADPRFQDLLRRMNLPV